MCVIITAGMYHIRVRLYSHIDMTMYTRLGIFNYDIIPVRLIF